MMMRKKMVLFLLGEIYLLASHHQRNIDLIWMPPSKLEQKAGEWFSFLGRMIRYHVITITLLLWASMSRVPIYFEEFFMSCQFLFFAIYWMAMNVQIFVLSIPKNKNIGSFKYYNHVLMRKSIKINKHVILHTISCLLYSQSNPLMFLAVIFMLRTQVS